MPVENDDKPTFQVLALHGGGIRGVATAAYLSDLESAVGEPAWRFFDLIVGTSTGGIIAAALSLGIEANVIKQLYLQKGHLIFRRKLPWLPRRLAQLVAPLYEGDELKRLLQETLGKETRMGDAHTRLCIPTVNLSTGRNEVLKTRHHTDFTRDHKLSMWRVAAATAAAPTYFPSVKIKNRGHYADGGLWANAPIAVGVAEAMKLRHPRSQIRVLSIGTGTSAFYKRGLLTGENTSSISYLDKLGLGAIRHGLAGWKFGAEVIDLVMRSQTQRARDLSSYLLTDDKLTCINFNLPYHMNSLDCIEHTSALAEIAHSEAKRTEQRIRGAFFRQTVKPFTPIP